MPSVPATSVARNFSKASEFNHTSSESDIESEISSESSGDSVWTKVKNNRIPIEEVKHYEHDPAIPYYGNSSTMRMDITDVLLILLNPDPNRIAMIHPHRVKENVSFLVRVEDEVQVTDLGSDQNGRWVNNSRRVEEFFYDTNERMFAKTEEVHVIGSQYKKLRIIRKYSKNKSCPDFSRIISYIYDEKKKKVHNKVAFLQYNFTGAVQPDFAVQPHGNAKGRKPFHPTKSSVKRKLKEKLKVKPPKQAVAEVNAEMGGLLGAPSSSSLVRRSQAFDFTREKKTQTHNPMADCVLLGQLQMEEKQFVRDVAVFPEPTIVVATDRQLHDLVRFCTADDVFSVVFIDPTYEHGENFVTPISHKHLMLKSNRTGKEPVRVGPVLLHMSKNLHPYYQFACVLCRERKSLKHIKFIGTDGEVNIFKGISLNMEQAGHLRCAVHFRRNIKDQLTAFGIKGYDQADFMNEIFGIELEDNVFGDGLLNCQDHEEFDHYLAMIELIWNERQKKLTKEQPSKLFSQYFREHADTIKS